MNKKGSNLIVGKRYLVSFLFVLLIGSFLANPGTVSAADQYILTLSTSGSGSISKSPDKSSYSPGEEVRLTAIPASGYVFSGWSYGLSGND